VGPRHARRQAAAARGSGPAASGGFDTASARRPDNASLDTIQNVIVVATRDKQRLDINEIVKRATAIDRGLFPDPIRDIAVAYFDKPLPEDVPVLTDDYAPTDNLLNP